MRFKTQTFGSLALPLLLIASSFTACAGDKGLNGGGGEVVFHNLSTKISDWLANSQKDSTLDQKLRLGNGSIKGADLVQAYQKAVANTPDVKFIAEKDLDTACKSGDQGACMLSENHSRICANHANPNLIRCNEDEFNNSPGNTQFAIVFHEYLSVAGIETNGASDKSNYSHYANFKQEFYNLLIQKDHCSDIALFLKQEPELDVNALTPDGDFMLWPVLSRDENGGCVETLMALTPPLDITKKNKIGEDIRQLYEGLYSWSSSSQYMNELRAKDLFTRTQIPGVPSPDLKTFINVKAPCSYDSCQKDDGSLEVYTGEDLSKPVSTVVIPNKWFVKSNDGYPQDKFGNYHSALTYLYDAGEAQCFLVDIASATSRVIDRIECDLIYDQIDDKMPVMTKTSDIVYKSVSPDSPSWLSVVGCKFTQYDPQEQDVFSYYPDTFPLS